MDIEQVNCQSNFSFMGGSNDRSLCFIGERTDRSVLFMDSRSQCISSGCIDNFMEEHVCLCIPSNLSDSESIKIYEAIQLQDHTNSSLMAKETLVSTVTGVTDRSSNSVTDSRKSTESAEEKDISSQSSNVKSDSMAPLDRNFETKGFSESGRKLLTASWRKGTQRDYVKKFEKFFWLLQNPINQLHQQQPLVG